MPSCGHKLRGTTTGWEQLPRASLIALVVLQGIGAGAQDGLAPGAAEQVSLQAQAAAASAVASERADWGSWSRGADIEGAAASGGKVERGTVYSQDRAWALPPQALTKGASCMPHCTGVCIEECQFREDPKTGLTADQALCPDDCKDMCSRGCKVLGGGGAKTGSKDAGQHDQLVEDAAQHAEEGRADDDWEDDSDDDGENAQTDGVGVQDAPRREEIPRADCIPVCLAECYPNCELASTQDPHICKGDCNSYCKRDCQLDQGVGPPDSDSGPLPEDADGSTFEYMSVDDAVLPHESPKMDSRDLGPSECEPHCTSECVEECQDRYHTPEQCPDECKRDCAQYCRPLQAPFNSVGDMLVREAQDVVHGQLPDVAAAADAARGSVGGQERLDSGQEAAVASARKTHITRNYLGGNPAVHWLVSSVGVVGAMMMLWWLLQRRLGTGKIYTSVPGPGPHSV